MKLTPLTHPNSYENLWNDPEIEGRIVAGIEVNRKSDGIIRVTGADGAPRAGCA